MTAGARAVTLLAAAGLVAYGLWSADGITDARWLALLGAAWLLVIAALSVRLPRSLPVFNRTVVRTALLLTSVFVVLAVQLVRIQAVQREATVYRVATAPDGEVIANPRVVAADLRIQRGRIFDREGAVLADTVPAGDLWRRVYPDPAVASPLGYFSPLLYGTAGLEAAYDAELTGRAGNNALLRWLRDLLHEPQEGLDLYLTLDAELQRVAHELLAGRSGAVVLLNAETGAVLALASEPSIDPNALFAIAPEEIEAASAYWQQLVADPAGPLLDRATAGLYPPGSTFKVLTAAAAIDAGLATPDEVYPDEGTLDVDGHVIVEQNRPDPTVTLWTLREALAWSLNVVFAQIGLELGAERLRDYAERFGFGEAPPFDLPVARSRLATTPDFLEARPALADTAFGQGQLQTTPLQMALVAATIANAGVTMRPYLVEAVATDEGDVVRRTEPEVWRRPIDPATALAVQAMMVDAVGTGFATGAAIDGVVVGGKTGTAETGEGEPHAWFIGFAGDPEPRFAVAVVLEHGGTGAITIAREMLRAAMADAAA